MSSFDFSAYDYFEPVEKESNKFIPTKTDNNKSKKQQELKLNNFDFSQYDNEELTNPDTSKNDVIYQQYAVPEKTPAELKKMSVQERMDYANDVNISQEYLKSAGTTKGLLSGATLGATEHVEALKPQPHEHGAGFGELVGSALPITGISKAIALPMKYAMKGYTQIPRSLKAVSQLMNAFGTGTTYSTGKQVIAGNKFSTSEAVMTGAQFATLDALFQGGGALFNKFSKISPKHQAQLLEQQVIPKDLPKSQYETAEEILTILTKEEPQTGRFIPVGQENVATKNVPALTSRVSTGNTKDLGLRPAPIQSKNNPVLAEEVGDIFSKNKFYNTTQGGEAIRNEIMNLDEDVYRGVNDLYTLSREANSTIDEIHPQLASNIENRLEDLRKIPEPSDVQRRLIRTYENVLNELVEFAPIKNEQGKTIGKEITGYKPVNNQTLIDQVQSTRQIVDYDFSHGNVKNIFKPLINDLQESALRAAELSGNPEAAEFLRDAKAGYKAWVEAFDNPYVRPFRDRSNQDFSKLFKGSLDLDESNMLKKILNLSETGRELSSASTREIVEKNLSKYFENPKQYTSKEFDKSLRELEAVITPEQSKLIKEKFAEASRKNSFKASKVEKKITNDEKIISKYLDKKPEDIQRMMNTRSGIREIREDLIARKAPKEHFERASQQKMRSILREGNIEKDFTGDDLYSFLNKEKNYELFVEFIGEKETEAMRLAAKEIGKEQVKSEMRKKLVMSALNNAAALKGLHAIMGVL